MGTGLDLDNLEAVREYLASFDIFAGKEAEGAAYLENSVRRFVATLRLIPAGGPGAKLLELGASPYLLTLLLKRLRSFELTLANYHVGPNEPHEPTGRDTAASARLGEAHEFPFDQFNVEAEVFPYPDAAFEVVLFCETLEHLLTDPAHALREVRRVLKPGGLVVVTTPNVGRLRNVLLLMTGRNVYDPYSGYGAYGRHNREFTAAELRALLSHCGFTEVRVKGTDIYAHSWVRRLADRLRPDAWCDNLHATARAGAQPAEGYPPGLYRSIYPAEPGGP